MTREEWRRVKAITTDALAVPEGERESFVAARCADPGLRREVQSLLGAALAAEDLFETSALTISPLGPSWPPPMSPPTPLSGSASAPTA